MRCICTRIKTKKSVSLFVLQLPNGKYMPLLRLSFVPVFARVVFLSPSPHPFKASLPKKPLLSNGRIY